MTKSTKIPASKPKKPAPKKVSAARERAPKSAKPRPRDPRLPKAGTVIQRAWHKKVVEISVGARDFTCAGTTYPSLSALARAVTGARSINGFRWAGLAPRPATRSAKAASGEVKSS